MKKALVLPEPFYCSIIPQRPIRRISVLCKTHSLVKQEIGGVEASSLRCRSWSCPICSKDRKKQLIAQGLAGKAQRFVTLTSKPGQECSPEDARRRLSQAWAIVVKRLRRLTPGTRLEYFAVTEVTKAGAPHLHILTRGPFIRQKMLSEWMRELTGWPIVDVRRIGSQRKAAAYVAKYVGKEPARLGTSKRYFKTQRWLLDWQQEDKVDRGLKADWQLVACSIERFKELALSAAYTIVEDRPTYFYGRGSP